MHERRKGGRNRSGPSDETRAGIETGPSVASGGNGEGEGNALRAVGDSMLRWGLASLVAAVALAGLLILAAVVAVALEPPDWVQLAIGVLLAVGSAALAWLIASAVRSRDGGS